MSNLMDWVMGTGPSPFAGLFSEGLAKRSNTPSGAYDQIMHADTLASDQLNRLWVVDRILEPQSVAHFLVFAFSGELLSGNQTSLPLLAEEQDYIAIPMTEWAPPPYNDQELSMLDSVMQAIGSHEDPSRLIPISKELHAMKSRVWEGIMPLSERRWTELNLDSPDQFHEACQVISAVTDVFHYLNIPEIKSHLRETYNLIWDRLDNFDSAIHALKLDSTDPDFSMAALWHEFIDDHFSAISSVSHRWVMDHIDRLRTPILDILSQDTEIGGFDVDEDYGEPLSDLIHDLHEGAAHADSAIFIPMDGYRGVSLPSQDHVLVNSTERLRRDPIEFSASTDKRKADYYFRVRYLSRTESFKMESLLDDSIARIAKDQIRAETQARQELRGDQKPLGVPRWLSQARKYLKQGRPAHWGYIGFRTYYNHTDQEWERFKANFQADISNWGNELGDIDDIRAMSVVEWKDAKEATSGGFDGVAAAAK